MLTLAWEQMMTDEQIKRLANLKSRLSAVKQRMRQADGSFFASQILASITGIFALEASVDKDDQCSVEKHIAGQLCLAGYIFYRLYRAVRPGDDGVQQIEFHEDTHAVCRAYLTHREAEKKQNKEEDSQNFTYDDYLEEAEIFVKLLEKKATQSEGWAQTGLLARPLCFLANAYFTMSTFPNVAQANILASAGTLAQQVWGKNKI